LPMPIIESARALLVDLQDRVLLMKLASNAHTSFWLTPGGSLHPGVKFEDALRREIREETGLTGAQPGHWVGRRPSASCATACRFTSQERNMFREFRWWSIDEIAGSRETFIPRTLAVFKQAIVKFFFNARAQTCR